jgi:hypothetical protein
LVGQLRRTDFPGPNRTLDVWALGADARVSMTERLGFKGEFFTGQSIGNYNAAILQVNNDLLEPIRSTGGWGEITGIGPHAFIRTLATASTIR